MEISQYIFRFPVQIEVLLELKKGDEIGVWIIEGYLPTKYKNEKDPQRFPHPLTFFMGRLLEQLECDE